MPTTVRHTADDEVSRALAAADPELGMLIDRVGELDIVVTGGGFEVMAESIVSQQLATKVAATIWRRVAERVDTSAEAIAASSHDTLRELGLSGRKAEYLHGIAAATLSGEVDWGALEALDDETVIETLMSLRGVGRWTAEMYLIFALGRPDVLALDDFGLRASAGVMSGLGRPMTRDELAERGRCWAPHRSTASLWLWAGHI